MGSFSIWHWLVVLLIVVLVFGTKKLRNLGQDLGSAIRGFKEGMKGGEEEAAATPPATGSTVQNTNVSANTATSATPMSANTSAAGAPGAPLPQGTVIEGHIAEKPNSAAPRT